MNPAQSAFVILAILLGVAGFSLSVSHSAIPALPRFKAQLTVLEVRRSQLDEAIETLKAASARLSQAGGANTVEQQQPAQRQA